MTEEQINKAIARVILSTKRKKRQHSLYDIALDIDSLKKAKGSISAVAKIIGISSGMLSQFLSVFKLPNPVIELVKKREIDSVSMVHHLSKFQNDDLLKLSELLSSNQLSSGDLRILIPYRKQYKNETILELVDKIHSSKNIKVSVIRINKDDTSKSISELNSIFSYQVGDSNVIEIEPNNDLIDIKITKQGENILREKARHCKKTIQELIFILIH